LRRAIDELAIVVERSRRIVTQTRLRLAGDKPDSAVRLVSLHDPDARPIAKGRINRPVEFGYKAQVMDNEDGVVLDYTLDEGNPADARQLAPAIARITARTGQAPAAVTADRGYGEARVENDLRDLGVRTVAIPRKGQTRPSSTESRACTRIPRTDQMADRRRGSHQPPQTPLRLGSKRRSRARTHCHLVRTRHPRPQPHKDHHPRRRLTNSSAHPPGDRTKHPVLSYFFRSK